MKINHETKIEISVATDFNKSSLEQEVFFKENLKVKEIINFIDQIEDDKDLKISIYEKSFVAILDESIFCVSILNPFINWEDIITYKNIYSYYERM